MRPLLCILLLCTLAACSTTDQSKAASAVTTPLSDLNIVKAPIPEILAAAQRGPYALPSAQDCQSLTTEITALDEALGPDLDAPPSEADHGLLERGTELASGAAVSAIQRSAEGLVPFRSWVRKLTGAERYSKRVAAAITAGGVRRAFLKGVRVTKNCMS